MREKIEDLRFAIGLFFAVISVILLGMGTLANSEASPGPNLNLRVGLFMVVFSVFMIGMTFLPNHETPPPV